MTIEQFNHYNEIKEMPQEWIGQGYGYKKYDFDWENGNPTDIIYIPEYAYYEGDDLIEVPRDCAYSKQDFIGICNGDESNALYLFECVDWQFPETMYNEIDWDLKEEVEV